MSLLHEKQLESSVYLCRLECYVRQARASVKFPCNFFVEWSTPNGKTSVISSRHPRKQDRVLFNEKIYLTTEVLYDNKKMEFMKKDTVVELYLVSKSRPDQNKLVGRVTIDLAKVLNVEMYAEPTEFKLNFCSVEGCLTLQFFALEQKLTSLTINDLDRSSFIDFISQSALKNNPRQTALSARPADFSFEKDRSRSPGHANINNLDFGSPKVDEHAANQHRPIAATVSDRPRMQAESVVIDSRKAEKPVTPPMMTRDFSAGTLQDTVVANSPVVEEKDYVFIPPLPLGNNNEPSQQSLPLGPSIIKESVVDINLPESSNISQELKRREQVASQKLPSIPETQALAEGTNLEGLKAELQMYKLQLKTKVEQAKMLEDHRMSLTERQGILTEKINELTVNQARIREECQRYADELGEKNASIEQLASQKQTILQESEAATDTLRAELKALASKRQQTQAGESEQAMAQIMQLLNKNREAEAGRKAAQKKQQQLQEQLIQYEAKFMALQAVNKKYKQDLAVAEKANVELQKQAKKHQQSSVLLQEQLNKQQEGVAELKTELEAVQTRTQREMSQKVGALTEQLQLKQTEIIQLTEALQEYSRRMKEAAVADPVMALGVEEEVQGEVVFHQKVISPDPPEERNNSSEQAAAIADLNGQLQDRQNEVLELRMAIADYKVREQEVVARLEGEQSNNEQLIQQYDDMKIVVEEVQQQLIQERQERKQEEPVIPPAVVEAPPAQESAERQQLAVTVEEMGRIEERNQELVTELDELQLTVATLQKQNEQLTVQFEEQLAQTQQQLQDALVKETQQQDSLRVAHQHEAEMQKLRGLMTRTEEIHEYKRKVLEKQVEELRNEVEQLSALQDSRFLVQQQKQRIKAQDEVLQVNRSMLEMDRQQIQIQREELEQLVGKIEKDRAEVDRHMGQLQQQATELKNQMRAHQKDKTQLEKDRAQVQKQKMELQRVRRQTDREKSQAIRSKAVQLQNSRGASLQDKCKIYEQTIAQLNTNLEDQILQNNEMSETILNFMEKEAKMKETLAVLEEESRQIVSLVREKEQNEEAYQRHIAELQDELRRRSMPTSPKFNFEGEEQPSPIRSSGSGKRRRVDMSACLDVQVLQRFNQQLQEEIEQLTSTYAHNTQTLEWEVDQLRQKIEVLESVQAESTPSSGQGNVKDLQRSLRTREKELQLWRGREREREQEKAHLQEEIARLQEMLDIAEEDKFSIQSASNQKDIKIQEMAEAYAVLAEEHKQAQAATKSSGFVELCAELRTHLTPRNVSGEWEALVQNMLDRSMVGEEAGRLFHIEEKSRLLSKQLQKLKSQLIKSEWRLPQQKVGVLGQVKKYEGIVAELITAAESLNLNNQSSFL